MVALALGAVAVIATRGGDDGASFATVPTTTGAPVASVEIDALPSLKYEPDVVHVPAGVVEFRLRDQAAGQHTFTIDGIPGFTLEVNNAGQVDTGKIELAPGEYHFSCSVPGHREAGEEGTLIVEDK
jgi:plastocyanin